MTDKKKTDAAKPAATRKPKQEPLVEKTGEMHTTDPAFEGGAMEVDSKPWNPPTK